MKNNADDTKNRILDSAEELFAEGGFDGVSARDITKHAKCNVASINYYFGGKDSLYNEICRRRLNALRDIRIDSINKVMAQGDGVTLEELFRAFSHAFLAPLLEDPKGRSFLKLMTREMLYPHMSAGLLVEELIMPVFKLLVEAICKICPGLSTENAVWSVHSLIAQLIHTIHIQTMMGDSLKGLPQFDVSEAVDHIVSFTAAGVRSLIENNEDSENV
ncbi:MAG: TetR/AcrR family transcriptional regulator [Planctomycetes bacterium]|nr:TetR/AcrR family transcriptional regulator [Planctomycetota bacterium]